MRKRVIIPKTETSITSISTSIDLLLHDAKSIIAAELSKYRSKVQRNVQLDLKEARVVQGYLETLIKLQREERDQARSEDLSNLTDAELFDLAAKVLGATKPKLLKDKVEDE